MLVWNKKNRKNKKRKSRRRSNLSYQTLERRQLLAVTASLTGTDFTLTGDLAGSDVVVSVNAANELQWSQNGGTTFTTDLDDGTVGTQAYVMSPAGTTPAAPINVTIDLKSGNDTLELDLDGHTGWQDVEVVDAGDADIDSVTIVSDLDLLSAGGELNIQAEEASVSPNVIVAAPEGISIAGTGHDALIEIGTNATLSARTILPGGDHHLDPSLADSSSITLTSKTINVADEANLFAHVEPSSAFTGGDIEMNASEDLPTSFEFYDLLNDIATGSVAWTDAINLFNQSATATIDIGSADLLASSIQLDARADTETEIPTLSDIASAVTSGAGLPAALQVASDYLSGQLTDFLVATGVFAAWRVKEVTTAVIHIGDDANLEADTDVVISATTQSKETNKVDNETQAIAVTLVESTSQVTIGEGTAIAAGNDVTVTTDATIEATAEAKTAKNLGATTPSEGTAIAVAVAKSNLNSNIRVAETALIRSGADLTLHAKGKQSVSTDAGAGIHVEGGVGIAAAFSFPKSNVTTDVYGSLRSEAGTDEKGIVILAELETDEQSVAITGLGGAAAPAPVSTLGVNVQAFLDTHIAPIMDALLLNNGSLVGTNLDFSTATAVIESDNNVAATVHGEANVGSTLDLEVESNMTAKVRTFAESVVVQDPATKPKGDVVSAAVTVGVFDNQTTASIEDGAVVDASRDLKVHATSEYPYNPPLEIVEDGGTRVIEVEGNSWARSHSSNGRSDFAGALTYQDYNNVTTAAIGDGVEVNQSPAFASSYQSVHVTADSDLYTLDIAGLFELVIDVTAITDTTAFQNAFQTGGLPALLTELENAAVTSWNDSDIDYGAGSQKTGVGGSSAYINIENETTASIGDQVLLNTGDDGELVVDADSRVRQYSFAMSGIEAGNLGIAGSLTHNQHENHTTASIGAGTQIVAGSVSVTSDSDLWAMGFAGGVLHAGNYGFGVSVATSNVDRQTNASIGSLAGGGGGSITTAGDLLVEANNQGGVYGFALSGAIQSDQLATSAASQNTNNLSGGVPSNFSSAGNQGSYGIGFSGDAAVNHVTNHANAFISENAEIEAHGVTVRATDQTSVVAAAGSAALTSKYRSVGLAGSFAYNSVNGSALAWIRDAQVITGSGGLNVLAERGAASGVWAGTASAGVSKGDLAAAINVSLNYSHWMTQANLYDATILAGRDALLVANDDSKTISIAAAAALQGKVGFGASFALNSMEGTTATGINNSTLDVQRRLVLESSNDSQIVSAAGSFGSGENFGFAGTVAINELNSVVESSITDSTVVAGSMVTVNATDDSSILSISGAVVAYDGSGFGGAFALNQVNQQVNAAITGSEVMADRLTSVRATANGEIKAFAVGVAGQKSWGFAGSMAINRLDSTVEARVADSLVEATRSVVVQADSKGLVESYAGGFAGAGTGAVGAAVSLNEIDAEIVSQVVDSVIASPAGMVRVLGAANSRLQSVAVGGTGAQSFALGGGVATNDIHANLAVNVTGSSIDSAKNVEVSAENSSLIKALSGGVAGAAGSAIGAGVSLNEINSSINSSVVDSQVSGKNVSVTASNDSDIESLAVGGAGAASFALGGGVATNEIQATMEARVTGSTIDAEKNVDVSAENSSEIRTLSGGVAGAGAYAIGAGVSLNEIESNMSASVMDSQINSGKDVSVTSSNDANIKALAVGGAGAASFALGGGVATNDIQNDMDAHITGSTINATKNVEVSAENTSQIRTLSGGLSGAGGYAVGAGVSLNEIESNMRACVVDSQVTSGGDVSVSTRNVSSIEALAIGGAGAGTFALGASVSVNRIGGMICSCIMDNSNVIAAGNISVTTFDASQIHALAPGFAGAGAVAIGISVVDNDINRTLKAVIADSDVNAGEDVIVDVTSRSGHRAIAVGGALSVDVAVAGSSSSNRITQETDAAVDGDSSVVAGSDVVIRSNVSENIETDVVQAAGSVGFSIAGAIASNHVDTVTTARVGKGVSVASQGNISIESIDDTVVDSMAGEVGLGVYLAGAGASVSTVQVHKDVQAYIDQQADVSAAAAHLGTIHAYSGEHDSNGNFLLEEIRGIEVQATSNESVNNTAFGVDAGLYAGVAAAVTATVVQPHVEAWIGREATVDADSGGTPGPNGEKAPTNVNVSAVNHSAIKDSATGVGIGAAGIAGAVDVGRVHHFVWGHIDNDAEVKALYDIDVHGLSQKLIDTDTIAAGAGAVGLSGSVSVWNIGAPFNSEYMLNGTKMKALQAGGTTVDQFASAAADLVDDRLDKRFGKGTPNTKDLYSDLHTKDLPTGVIATIKQNAILTAGDDIDVRAREWMLVDAATGSAGVGLYAGVGAAVAITNVHSDTDAGVFGHLNAGDDTLVQATLEESTVSKSLSGAVGIGAAGAAVGIVNESSEQSARVAYGGWIESTDRLLVEADENLAVDVTNGLVGIGFGAGAASVSEIYDTGLTEAYLDDAIIGYKFDGGAHDVCDPGLSQVRLAVVRTNVDHDLTTKALGLVGGLVAVGVTVSRVDDQHQMQTWVGGGSTVVLQETLAVGGVSTLNGNTNLTALTTGAVGVAVPRSNAELKPAAATYIENAMVCVGEDVFVRAENDSQANAQGLAAGIVAVGVEAIDIDALAKPDVQTWIEGRETRVLAGRDVVVESLVNQDAEVDATRASVSAADLGSLEARADVSGDVSTRVGQSAKLHVGNDFTIRSETSGDSVVGVVSPTVSGLIIHDNNVVADASFDAEAQLGAVSAAWIAGDTLVESTTDRNAETDVVSGAVTGAVGATSNVRSIANGNNSAVVSGRVNSTNDLTVIADENNRTISDADSFSVSLVSGSGLESRTIANPLISASISAPVDASGNVDVAAGADLTTLATGRTIGVSGVTFGAATIVADSAPTIVAELTGGAELTTDGDISVTAQHTVGPDTAGQPAVTGFAATVGLLGGATGMTLRADSDPQVSALVGDGALVIETDDLSLESRSETQLSVEDKTISVSGLVGLGGTHGIVHSGGNVTSQLGGTIGKVDDVTLSSTDVASVDVRSQATTIAGVAAVPSGEADAMVDPSVQTWLTTNLNATGDVVMRSESILDSDAYVKLNAAALAAAAGKTDADASIALDMDTVVAPGVAVYADGSIELESRHNVDGAGNLLPFGASASAESANGTLGVGVADSVSTARSNPDVSTRADQGAVLFTLQGDISLRSQSFSDAVADTDGKLIAAAGKGSVTATAESGGSVESVLNDVELAFTRSGDIEVYASTRNDSTVSAIGTAYGIVGGVDAVKADARSTPDALARVGAANGIEAGRDVRVIALGSGDVDAAGESTGKAGLFNFGEVNVSGKWLPTVLAEVDPTTRVQAGRDLSVLAFGNALDESGAFDTSRRVTVDSETRGGAVVVGRTSRANVVARSNVDARVGEECIVYTGDDVTIDARAFLGVDADSFSRLFGLAAASNAYTDVVIESNVTAEILGSAAAATTVNTGDDVLVNSESRTRVAADAEARAIAIGWSIANSEANTKVNTFAFLGANTLTTAVDDVTVRAKKGIVQNVNAATGLLGTPTTNSIVSANTQALLNLGNTTAGGTILVQAIDPIINTAQSRIRNERVSDADWKAALADGLVAASATVKTDATLIARIDSASLVKADHVKVITHLRKLDTHAETVFRSKRKQDIRMDETEELKLVIQTQLADEAEINRELNRDPKDAITYRAELTRKRGKVTSKENYFAFDGSRGKGNSNGGGSDSGSDKKNSKKDKGNVDSFFGALGGLGMGKLGIGSGVSNATAGAGAGKNSNGSGDSGKANGTDDAFRDAGSNDTDWLDMNWSNVL